MIHIDGIIFSLQAQGGISVYFRELMSRLQRNGTPTHLSLETPLKAALTPALARPVANAGFSVSVHPARRLERYRDARVAPSGRATTVFHSSYYRRPQARSLPTVVTVHDFAYERCLSGPRRWVHSAQKYAAIRSAQAVICISEATRDDLLDLVGLRADQQLHVIYNGVGEQFRPLAAAAQGDKAARFVLFVGMRGRYKNFSLLLQAMGHCPELELHCVGGGAIAPDELRGVSADVARRVRHLGPVSDERLNALYNQAACLAYPSAYEGFGIPVLEAMRAGCPVVCIPCKAVLEVGQDALLVAEADPMSLAAKLQAAAQEAGQQARARGLALSQTFSWERTFQQTLAVYRQLGASDA